MKEERYLQLSISQNELTTDIKKFIMIKLNEKYLYREIESIMITDIDIINFNNLEINIHANIIYKKYKPGDIISGEIFSNDRDDRVFVLSYDILCEILNIDDFNKIKDKNNVYVKLTYIKSTNGCFYFLAQGEIINN